jgi:hypothetical protein
MAGHTEMVRILPTDRLILLPILLRQDRYAGSFPRKNLHQPTQIPFSQSQRADLNFVFLLA